MGVAKPYRPDPLALAVGTLAAYRVTMLVTSDAITEPLRAKAQAYLDKRPSTEHLTPMLECAWCAGMWVAVPATALTLAGQRKRWWWLGAGSLAASAITGVIATYASPNA